MSKHWPVYDGHYATHCKCGYGEGISFGRYDDDAAVRRHVDKEYAAAIARESSNTERVRLLTQGQNWELP